MLQLKVFSEVMVKEQEEVEAENQIDGDEEEEEDKKKKRRRKKRSPERSIDHALHTYFEPVELLKPARNSSNVHIEFSRFLVTSVTRETDLSYKSLI